MDRVAYGPMTRARLFGLLLPKGYTLVSEREKGRALAWPPAGNRIERCPGLAPLGAWRRREASLVKWGIHAAMVGVWIAASILATAQVVESNQAREIPSLASVPHSFEVRGYRVAGNTVLPPAVIDRLLAKRTGSEVTVETIRQAVTDLQRAYRERGYVTVNVALPPQVLTNGMVRMQVTESRLSQITVEGNRYCNSNDVLRALPSLHTNMLLNSLVFQKELDRANRNPDRQIYPEILPGAEPGTSTLVLKVKDRLPSPEKGAKP